MRLTRLPTSPPTASSSRWPGAHNGADGPYRAPKRQALRDPGPHAAAHGGCVCVRKRVPVLRTVDGHVVDRDARRSQLPDLPHRLPFGLFAEATTITSAAKPSGSGRPPRTIRLLWNESISVPVRAAETLALPASAAALANVTPPLWTTTSSRRRRVAETPRLRAEATVTDRGLCGVIFQNVHICTAAPSFARRRRPSKFRRLVPSPTFRRARPGAARDCFGARV
jgi:hypothetical protein